MKISALAALQTEDGSITVNIDPEGVGPDSATDARGSGGESAGYRMTGRMWMLVTQGSGVEASGTLYSCERARTHTYSHAQDWLCLDTHTQVL
jgi:hypothetical protein